jgi:hypothetical protein
MNELKNEIAARLKEIRTIVLEGKSLSASQFASLIGEKSINYQNYESGKANLPVRVLVSLYYRGFNPIYILTGDGSVFADNEKGRELQKSIASKKENKGNINMIAPVRYIREPRAGDASLADLADELDRISKKIRNLKK